MLWRARSAAHLQAALPAAASSLRPQRIVGRQGVLALVAARAQEIWPIRTCLTVLALGNRTDTAGSTAVAVGAADPGEHPLARLLEVLDQLIGVPAYQLPVLEHDLARDQNVADVPGVHHRHDRARRVVDRCDIDIAGIQ